MSYQQTVSGTCLLCGSAFTKKARGVAYKFCSRYCAVRGRQGSSRKHSILRSCVKCGSSYSVNKARDGLTKYCSNKCKQDSSCMRGAANPNYKGAGIRVCVACGDNYRSYNKARKYCSSKCSYISASDLTVICLRRGDDAETMCKIELQSRGLLATKTKNSRGPFDVLAVGDGKVFLIQVKRTIHRHLRHQKKAFSILSDVCAQLGTNVERQVWCWVDGHGWFITRLDSDKGIVSFWGLDDAKLPCSQQGELNLMRDNPFKLGGFYDPRN